MESEAVPAEPAPATSRRRRDNLRGALLIVAAAAAFAVTAALVKGLGESGISPFQTVLVRAVIGIAIVTPLLARRGIAPWKTDHPKLHSIRALTGGVAIIAGFYAFTRMPLAEATAFGFTTPMFVTVLAVLLLGEKTGWRRWSATAAGFLGVMVIVRPGSQAFDPAAFYVLLQALCIAFSVTVVKKFPARESQLSMMFFTFVSSGLLSLWPAIEQWQDPTRHQALLLAAMACAGIIAQALVLRGYRLGEASFVAPFSYIRLIFVGALGAIWFAEFPDGWTWAGAAVIVASTLYIARREAVVARRGR